MAEGTKERLLDAAEGLFAERGFDGTSVRAITARAGVNLAAVNYHFGSKEALIEAVFDRRVGPLNRERLRRLDELLAAAGDARPDPRALVEAFLEPAIRMCCDPEQGGPTFMRLLGQTYGESSHHVGEKFYGQFREVARRYVEALTRALPGLSAEEAFWRMVFLVGAMAHTMVLADRLPPLFGALCGTPTREELARRLVPFVAAGLATPATRPLDGEAGKQSPSTDATVRTTGDAE